MTGFNVCALAVVYRITYVNPKNLTVGSILTTYRKNIDLASYTKKADKKWRSFGEVLGGESKVSNSTKPRITCNALTTFVVLDSKGLNVPDPSKKGNVTTYRNGSVVVMQWTDKCTLVSLSTKHSNPMVSIQSR